MPYLELFSDKYKTKDNTNYKTLVDEDLYEELKKYRWNLSVQNRNGMKSEENDTKTITDKKEDKDKISFYAKTCIKDNKVSHYIVLHHWVFGRTFNYKPRKGYVIAHLNNDKLDNRRENLREITLQQSNQNRKSKDKKYKGLSWQESTNKWLVRVGQKYVGHFEDEEKAARAYDYFLINNPELGISYNFSYTEEEIKKIKSDFVKPNNINDRELPKHICLTESNKYYVQIRSKYLKVNKTCETLEDAIEFRDECLEEIKTIKINNKNKGGITKNKDGIACLKVKYDDKYLECLVDDDKWEHLNSVSTWSYNGEYIIGRVDNEQVKLHRYLYSKYKSEININELIIDHINGTTSLLKRLDNRMNNLRHISYEQNSFNLIETDNKTGFRGVVKQGKLYISKLLFEKKLYKSEKCETVEEAALAWNKLVTDTYGKKYGMDFIKDNLNKVNN
jgi:hemerythrin/post-segregation antitoxin (ccd killing protein)